MSSCQAKKTFAKAIDTVRLLSADGVQKANSGHPGMPMGCADFAFTLWHDFLRFDPQKPDWFGRDRFVLSAGHGSMLLYSLLHLFELGLTIEDLKEFRQWGSLTAGHPEYGHTPGVDVTTGPLASGLASGVGMAIGLKQFAAQMGNSELFNQKVYVLSGDGCIMEGTSHEACAIAGHQKLDNLILFYDDNSITIEGSTDIAMSEDVGARFAAYGWNVLRINGQCVKEIRAALTLANACHDKPTIIIGKTVIGYGSPKLAGSSASHGAPLGADELAATKKALGFDPEKSFFVPDDVRKLCQDTAACKGQAAAEWNAAFAKFKAEAGAEKAALLDALLTRRVPANILDELLAVVPEKATATRNSGGIIMQKAAALVPALTGGSADLNPSTKTYLNGLGDFTPADRSGRNLHFGVRELGMGLICNGLALNGNSLPFCATFMVFSDYMKPALRLAALQKLHVIFVFTHDSIFVGEDGPTHQPIEQLAMFRGIPGLTVIRPADSYEVAHAWATALQADGPVVICLTRQNLPNLPADVVAKMAPAKGAYVVSSDDDFEMILIGSGSELECCMGGAEILRKAGHRVRVVSMPSWELFEQQSCEYKESVLPSSCCRRLSIEAGSTMGWARYVGSKGVALGIDHFGASAPCERLAQEYGFTSESVAEHALAMLKK
ncbi:MAG: transketolase [Oligosphaeraceae bacterium]|nr:transketolase [Oligosphaeraceae bacterium]